MRVLGIVAEYNPFHNGHLYHIRKARELVRPDITIVVLSSCFTQRGEMSLFSPSARARMALSCGADAVFALPAVFVLRDAEHYCYAAVRLLSDLGATHIAFGAEEQNTDLLFRVAEKLNQPDNSFGDTLREKLDLGLGYPAAVSAALDASLPDCAGIMNHPNNILAVNYLRAILRDDEIRSLPVIIHRKGAYYATEVDESFPSASAIRSAILRGDWRSLSAVPESVTGMILQESLSGRIAVPDVLSRVLSYSFLSDPASCYRLPDLSEGLGDRISHALSNFGMPQDEMLDMLSSKRYSRARMNRLLACQLLGIDHNRDLPEKMPVGILLGIRKGIRLPQNGFPIVAKIADYSCTDAWFTTEVLAYDLFALASAGKKGLIYRQGVVTVP